MNLYIKFNHQFVRYWFFSNKDRHIVDLEIYMIQWMIQLVFICLISIIFHMNIWSPDHKQFKNYLKNE